jgi:hypothetical protein
MHQTFQVHAFTTVVVTVLLQACLLTIFPMIRRMRFTLISQQMMANTRWNVKVTACSCCRRPGVRVDCCDDMIITIGSSGSSAMQPHEPTRHSCVYWWMPSWTPVPSCGNTHACILSCAGAPHDNMSPSSNAPVASTEQPESNSDYDDDGECRVHLADVCLMQDPTYSTDACVALMFCVK